MNHPGEWGRRRKHVLHQFTVHILCVTNDGSTCTCRPLYPNCSLFRTEMLRGIGLYWASRSAGGYLSVADSPSLCTVLQLLYRIAGNFRGRKLSRIGEKYDFRGLLAFAMPKDTTPPNFVEKTFTDNHKTAKFAKVFSLESFPLYGSICGCAGMLDALLSHCMCAVIRTVHTLLYYSYNCGWWNVEGRSCSHCGRVSV